MPNEAEELFAEIQDDGMADIGTAVTFAMDGGNYNGIVSSPDAATQMLTGSYQGRSTMVILATRDQFSSPPSQRGVLTINSEGVFKASQWDRKEVNPYGANHYAITVLHQLPTT